MDAVAISDSGQAPTRRPRGHHHHYPPPQQHQQRGRAFCVRVSSLGFALWWLGFVLVHALAMAFFVTGGYLYHFLPDTLIALNFEYYALTLDVRHYPLIGYCHYAIAAGHAYCLLGMLLNTLYYREVTFFARRSILRRSPKERADSLTFTSALWQWGGILAARWLAVWEYFFSYRGVFGVAGRYFEVVYLLREAFETILQSYQAYRMSWFIPSQSLNRLYVGVLVVNCLLTPTMHHVVRSSVAVQRLLCLILDIFLDFFSTIIIPTALAIPYIREYDPAEADFPLAYWYNNYHLIRIFNEFRLIMVTSWTDLISKLFFSFGLISGIQGMKALLYRDRDLSPSLFSDSRIASLITGSAAKARARISPNGNVLNGDNRSRHQIKVTSKREGGQLRRGSTVVVPVVNSGHRKRLAQLSHVLMFIWGVGVLGFHLRAELRSDPHACGLKVRPWTSSKPGCSLVEYNCKFIPDAVGSTTEMDEILQSVDSQALTYLVIRHCPQVQVPATIHEFTELMGIKMYNSTVDRWAADGALTESAHPNVRFAFFVRVNFTNGMLPEGLLARDFPVLLTDIEFSVTNVRTLPSDLRHSWKNTMCVVFEGSLIDEFPEVLLTLQLSVVALMDAPLRTIDPRIFLSPDLFSIHFSGSQVNRLPELPSGASPPLNILSIKIWNTPIETLPEWIVDQESGYLALGGVVKAGGSPFCEAFNQVVNGNRTGITGNESWLWMFESGRETFQDSVVCKKSPYDGIYYPTSVEEYD